MGWGYGLGDGRRGEGDAIEGSKASVGAKSGALFGEGDLGGIKGRAAEESGGAFGDTDPALFDIHGGDIFVTDGEMKAILDGGKEFAVHELEADIEGFFHVDVFFDAEEKRARSPLVGGEGAKDDTALLDEEFAAAFVADLADELEGFSGALVSDRDVHGKGFAGLDESVAVAGDLLEKIRKGKMRSW